MHLLRRTTGVICLGAPGPAGAYVPLPDVDLALRAEDVPASVRSSVFTADPLPLPNGGFPRAAPTAQLGASDSGGDASLGLLQMQQTEQLRGLQLGLVTTKSALPGVDSHVYEDEAVDWWRRTHHPQEPAAPSSSASAGHAPPAPRQRVPVSLVTASTSSTSSVENAVADAQPAAVPRRRKAGFLLNSAPASVKKTSDTANHGGGEGGGRRNSAPGPGASKVLEEYDVVTPPVAAVVLSGQSESAPLVTKNKEAVTRDEQWRKRSGVGIDLVPGGRYTGKDVAYIQHLRTSAAKVNVGAANGVNYRATTAIVRPPTSTTSTAAAQQQPTVVALNQKQQVSLAAATRASTSASVSVSAAQCESFANFLKENGVKGSKLIMQWHGSCEKSFPAKCSAIVAAVTPFADQLNWNVKKLCGAVMSAITE